MKVGGRMKFDWLVDVLHAFPHFNFQFHFVSNVFDPTSGSYLEVQPILSVSLRGLMEVGLMLRPCCYGR